MKEELPQVQKDVLHLLNQHSVKEELHLVKMVYVQTILNQHSVKEELHLVKMVYVQTIQSLQHSVKEELTW